METNTIHQEKEQLLILPPVEQVELNKVKRRLKQPDTSTLTKSQAIAFKELLAFLKHPTKRMVVLEGWAGTGKTFLISMLIEYYLMNGGVNSPTAGVTAPTNKAVRVLTKAAEYHSDSLEYVTVHKLLGLKPSINRDTGRMEFIKDFLEPCSIEYLNLLIEDEVSMLNDELFGLMEKHTTGKLKIIFVGDGEQIPPIGQKYSIPFNPKEREKYSIDRIVLSDPVRQSEGSPVLPFLQNLRTKIHHPYPVIVRESSLEDGQGVLYLPNSEIGYTKTLLRLFFTSENFKQNPDFCKVICWRKVYVKKFNNLIRKYIFGEAAKKVYIGEKLITNSEVIDIEGNPSYKNNEELEVTGISTSTRHTAKKTFKYYQLEVFSIFGKKGTRVINMVHEDSEQEYITLLDTIAKYANQQKGSDRAKAWEQFHNIKAAFADVAYNYAITAHKCQGSTYTYAFIAMEDIYAPRKNVYERNRIGYTACSRAEKVVFMLGDL